ncbi:MAG: MmgE/PrpD family protein [Proteobacteria bacterium]|nr:MAG: MmgE/PrpD family protein [Pseudomonadota bacterium]
MNPLTESLARFAHNPAFTAIPEDAVRIVRNGFIDTIATMIAGRNEPVVRIVREHVASRGSAPRESSILLGPEKVAAQDAALINGTAGHALDYDDVALAGHPSTVLVPALLAEGEAIGASGAELIRAYVVGYEVWADLIARDADSHHLKGWHPTAVFGTVGAAAAIASLRRLSLEVCRNAIALSASMASGVVANFGTMTKPLHAGRAASSAIDSVRLAMRGLSASPDAIEHPAGFLSALSPKGRVDVERPAEALGRTLRLIDSGLSVKKYPICYATHRVIDAVIDLARREDLRPEAVESVHATIGVAQASMLRNHAPVTALEAKFSLEFAVASALTARAVGLAQLTDEFVNRPTIRDAMKKLTISTIGTACPIEPAFAFSDRVRLRLRDGRTIDSGDIRFARGNAHYPLREGELEAKFRDCLAEASDIDARTLYRQISRLDTLRDAKELATTAAVASVEASGGIG